MKRWLSLIKKHVVPGTWTRPAKKRRPLTLMTHAAPSPSARDVYETTRPLVPLRAPKPLYPPCDVGLILERHLGRDTPSPFAYSLARPSSQALPLVDLSIPAQAFVDHSFIHFEPTFTVTVTEVAPYALVLRKPRGERISRRIHSFFRGD